MLRGLALGSTAGPTAPDTTILLTALHHGAFDLGWRGALHALADALASLSTALGETFVGFETTVIVITGLSSRVGSS